MWEPKASNTMLKKRALLLHKIRTFFLSKSVMEVDVPVLGEHSVTDPYLDALSVNIQDKPQYLQTSPEYFMKRLLAAGSGDIYYLGKAFRADELGRIHHREFTMLEWYRLDFDEQQLMYEVVDLVQSLDSSVPVAYLSYQEAFERHVGINPHCASSEELAQLSKSKIDVSFDSDDVNTWLDLLFTHCVEANLPKGLVFIFDFPESQAALAKVQEMDLGYSVAKRFEAYFDGVELANGYLELSDCEEQKARFRADNIKRELLGKRPIDIDPHFLSAMASGLPDCSGVALGVDRLMMKLLGVSSISEQRSF